jgi:hypothetical protein
MAKAKEKYGLKRYIYEDRADKMGVVKQRTVMTMRSFMNAWVIGMWRMLSMQNATID